MRNQHEQLRMECLRQEKSSLPMLLVVKHYGLAAVLSRQRICLVWTSRGVPVGRAAACHWDVPCGVKETELAWRCGYTGKLTFV